MKDDDFFKKMSYRTLLIRIFAVIFGVLVLADVVATIRLGAVKKDLLEIASTEELAPDSDDEAEKPSPHVESMSSPTAKAQIDEMRRRYNRRHKVIAVVERKLTELKDLDMLPASVDKLVSEKLAQMGRENEDLLRQYKAGVAIAEQEYAEGYINNNTLDAEGRIRELEQRNREVLKQMDAPVSF